MAYKKEFLEFIDFFEKIGQDNRIFPKKCRTCGFVYNSFPDYIHSTKAVNHCLEDYRDLSVGHGTMQYRNCNCGSTLTINFNKKEYPMLDRFWEMIGKESLKAGKQPREILEDFREQCNRRILEKRSAGKDRS